MKIQNLKLARPLYGLATMLLLFSATIASLAPSMASAAQVQSRYIKMSSSTPGATGVHYDVHFQIGSSYTLRAIVIDFCDHTSTPLIGDATCTAPAGFGVGASPTVTNNPDGDGTVNVGSWTASQTNTQRTFSLTDATGAAVTNASIINFSIDTVTNTTDVGGTTPNEGDGTFYARVLTYNTNSPTYAPGTEGAYSDYGGFALSTASAINITARVMESLSFCVYLSACGDTPSITIGHGGNTILDATLTDTKTVTFSLSTNANGGAKVNLKGDTLKSGSNDIDPMLTAGSITPGTENFGMYISTAGSMSATSPYGTTTSDYALDTNGTTGTMSTYGQQIASIATPVNGNVTVLTYGATASNTTAAGIYTATHQLIATGTF